MSAMGTVGELLDYLKTQPRDRLVILSKDAEGNIYSPLTEVDEGQYFADSPWSGEVNYEAGEEDGGVRAVVLSPVN